MDQTRSYKALVLLSLSRSDLSWAKFNPFFKYYMYQIPCGLSLLRLNEPLNRSRARVPLPSTHPRRTRIPSNSIHILAWYSAYTYTYERLCTLCWWVQSASQSSGLGVDKLISEALAFLALFLDLALLFLLLWAGYSYARKTPLIASAALFFPCRRKILQRIWVFRTFCSLPYSRQPTSVRIPRQHLHIRRSNLHRFRCVEAWFEEYDVNVDSETWKNLWFDQKSIFIRGNQKLDRNFVNLWKYLNFSFIVSQFLNLWKVIGIIRMLHRIGELPRGIHADVGFSWGRIRNKCFVIRDRF